MQAGTILLIIEDLADIHSKNPGQKKFKKKWLCRVRGNPVFSHYIGRNRSIHDD
jgi:hypothetical protein